MIKDTDEQLDEEIHRARAGSVLRVGPSVLTELGVCHPPSEWMCSQTWKLSKPSTLGGFIEASLHWRDQSFLAPLHFLEDRAGLKVPSF